MNLRFPPFILKRASEENPSAWEYKVARRGRDLSQEAFRIFLFPRNAPMKIGPPRLRRRQGREAEEMKKESIPRADRNEEGEIKSGELEVYRNGSHSNYCPHFLKEQWMKSSACFPDH